MPKTLKRFVLPVATTGSAGSATGSTNAGIPGGYGQVVSVSLDYSGSAPATTDVTIKSNGETILTVSNNKTDGVYYPRAAVCDSAGSAISGEYTTPTVSRDVTVEVADCDALAVAVTAAIIVEI